MLLNFLRIVLWQLQKFFLLRCSNALTCQSQLNHVGQEVQFLALFKPKHTFSWPPEWISSSRRFLLTLYFSSFSACFCFVSGSRSHLVLPVVCAQTTRYLPLEAAQVIRFYASTSLSKWWTSALSPGEMKSIFFLSLHMLTSSKKILSTH